MRFLKIHFYISLLIFLGITDLLSCKKETKDQSEDELIRAARNIVWHEIDRTKLNDAKFDYNEAIKQISNLSGVAKAVASPTGTTITVDTKNETSFDIFVFQRDDASQYTVKPPSNNIKTLGTDILEMKGPEPDKSNSIFPLNKKALILAPFQKDFGQDLKTIKKILEFAGYEVVEVYNEDATLDKFKGDYLAEFGMIYISTHGAYTKFKGDTYNTALLTGEEVSKSKSESIPLNEYQYIKKGALGSYFGENIFYALSAKYMQETLHKKFLNSWVFIDACESSKNSDLGDFFLSNGAAAFNGYSLKIDCNFADAIGIEMLSFVAAGFDLDHAYTLVRSYQGLNGSMIVNKDEELIVLNSLTLRKANYQKPFNLIRKFDSWAELSPKVINRDWTIAQAIVLWADKDLFMNMRGRPFNISANIGFWNFQTSYYKPGSSPGYVASRSPFDSPFNSASTFNGLSFLGFNRYPKAVVYFFTGNDANGNVVNKTTIPFTLVNY